MVSESSNNSEETFLLLRPCLLWSVPHSEPRRILFNLQLDSVLRLLKPPVAQDSLKGKAKVFAGTHKAPRDPPTLSHLSAQLQPRGPPNTILQIHPGDPSCGTGCPLCLDALPQVAAACLLPWLSGLCSNITYPVIPSFGHPT